MFSEMRELFEAVIEEHAESLDESEPRQEFKKIMPFSPSFESVRDKLKVAVACDYPVERR